MEFPKNKIVEHNGRLRDEYMFYYKTDEVQTIGVGKIPIGRYLRNLYDTRKFNRQLIYSYTKEVYGIDLSEILDENQIYFWDGRINIYDHFENENPRKKEDDSSRKYFNSYGRRYFEKYHELYFDCNMVMPYQKYPTDVHHIFPLSCGGDNSLFNLIYISNGQHEILHCNPVQHVQNANFEALDFMIDVLSHGCYRDMVYDYNLQHVFDRSEEEFRGILYGITESKTKRFYKRLQDKYEKTNKQSTVQADVAYPPSITV